MTQDQMHYSHPYKVGNIDLIFEMGWLSYAHEDSKADNDYINLDVASDNVWMSDKPESPVYIVWEGSTRPDNIKALAVKLYKRYQASLTEQSSIVSIGIFQDDNGHRHALLAEVYKAFKKSKFWLTGYKHIGYTDRPDLDQRQIKALEATAARINKLGMFDLVANNWTLQGDIPFTQKQAVTRQKKQNSDASTFRSWERTAKRLDLVPSAANTILGKMASENVSDNKQK